MIALNQKLTRQVILMVLLTLTAVVYWPVTHHLFINYDDNLYVTRNDHVQAGFSKEGIRWAFSVFKSDEVSYYHPVTWLSHMLDCQIFGLEPGMHHLSSLGYHLLNVTLLYCLFMMMTGAVWESAYLAALFALHPINVDSVAWVAERKNLLSTTFWFTTMMAYVYYARRPSVKRYLPMVVSFILGLMAKPMLYTLPFVLLLMDYWPLYRFRWNQRRTECIQSFPDASLNTGMQEFQASPLSRLIMEKFPLLAFSIVSIVMSVMTMESHHQLSNAARVPFSLRISNAVVSYGVYLKKMLWPVDLTVFYPFPASIPLWKSLVAVIMLIFVSALVIHQSKKRPYLIIGWLWYLGTLVPVIGLVQASVWPAVADRWAYVPLIGIFIMSAWAGGAVVKFTSNKAGRVILSSCACVILMLLCIQTTRQLKYWENDETLFYHAIEVTKNNFVAHNSLGSYYAIAGNINQAMNHFAQAYDIAPYNFRILKSFALFLAQYGNPDKALALLDKARTADRQDNELVIAMGDAYFRKNNFEKAIQYYSNALQKQSCSASIYNNLGNAYFNLGNFKEAVKAYDHARSCDPNDPIGYYNIGTAMVKMNRLTEAVPYFKKALEINPEYRQARAALDHLVSSMGNAR